MTYIQKAVSRWMTRCPGCDSELPEMDALEARLHHVEAEADRICVERDQLATRLAELEAVALNALYHHQGAHPQTDQTVEEKGDAIPKRNAPHPATPRQDT